MRKKRAPIKIMADDMEIDTGTTNKDENINIMHL